MTVVTTQLVISDATPKVKGFGTVLIAGHHTAFADVRTYSADSDGLTSMVSDGISVDNEIYCIAQAIVAMNPHVSTLKVGKLSATPVANGFSLTVTEAVVGRTYWVTLQLGSKEPVTFSMIARTGATPTTLAAGFSEMIDMHADFVCTYAGPVINVLSSSTGAKVKTRGFCERLTLINTISEATTDYSTDLAAINAEDSDWYGLLITGTSDGALAVAQTFAEANGKLFMGLCPSSAAVASGSLDALSVASSSHLHRSGTVATRDWAGRADAQALCQLLAIAPPNVATIHGKALAGARVDTWSATAKSYITAKHGISYYNEAGIPMLHDGWAASGRYLDLTVLADWVVARIDEALIALIANARTIPFNSAGEAMVQNAVSGVLTLAESAGVIAPAADKERGWKVTVPRSVDIPAATRAARKMPGVKFQFFALGSVQTLEVVGSMGV
jgi:hypothetical protein